VKPDWFEAQLALCARQRRHEQLLWFATAIIAGIAAYVAAVMLVAP
jgi:hypothetical protein